MTEIIHNRHRQHLLFTRLSPAQLKRIQVRPLKTEHLGSFVDHLEKLDRNCHPAPNKKTYYFITILSQENFFIGYLSKYPESEKDSPGSNRSMYQHLEDHIYFSAQL